MRPGRIANKALIDRVRRYATEVLSKSVSSITPCPSGVASANYLVYSTSGDVYIARCDFRRPASDLAVDSTFQACAERAGVDVPPPITHIVEWPECVMSLRAAILGTTLEAKGDVEKSALSKTGRPCAWP